MTPYAVSFALIVISAVFFLVVENTNSLSPRTRTINFKNTQFNILFGFFSLSITFCFLLFIKTYLKTQIASPQFLDTVPFLFEIIFCIILFDLITWTLHILNHNVQFLRRWHSIHHSDLYLNTSSAIRFHFIELIVSTTIHIFLAQLIGFSAESIIIYRTMFMMSNLFQHSNLSLNSLIDQLIAPILVTPKFHHQHHSVVLSEQNSNYGSIFSVWDRIFKTYTVPRLGIEYGVLKNQENLIFGQALRGRLR